MDPGPARAAALPPPGPARAGPNHLPIGHINHVKLSPVEKEPNFRRKIFRNRYGGSYPFEYRGPGSD
ncbi:MAG: hypothetical protein A3G35_10020 [candidate division NC10 bacterium RIFCSPLOWO2_12_FULL_66_18]|nr:MAG: hypothetical protein A3H39_17970 [candidate division NC10 bacterium RIFCSPLOWO2_02_FULL_66_22]OGB96906.1 MAG: hypothetical protein A3G35_10020 [candidate division NC10 bacterium RIFCSPLOWO2_12_FULL_66_18]